MFRQIGVLWYINWVFTVCKSTSVGFSSLLRGSYMSAHVLLNLLNELEKEIKCEAC